MSQLYETTMKIDELIKTKCNLVTIWEHDFDKNKEMYKINLSEDDLIEPPKIRDVFYGGRTEPTKLIYNFKKYNNKGRYIDICSLYPTVMYYDKYPIGHPEKIIKPSTYDFSWFDNFLGMPNRIFIIIHDCWIERANINVSSFIIIFFEIIY